MIKKSLHLLCFFTLFPDVCIAQLSAIDIIETTRKIKAKETDSIFVGFAEGDKIIFSFSEEKNKELTEIYIYEYPNNLKYSEYKVSRIEQKLLNVSKNSVYKFVFKNNSLAGRVCQIKIRRFPANEQTKNFNTNVDWITKTDTTYKYEERNELIDMIPSTEQYTQKELVSVDTVFEEFFTNTVILKDKDVLIQNAPNTNQVTLSFNLPQNNAPFEFNPYKKTETQCWSYWIESGTAASQRYAKMNQKIIGTVSSGLSLIKGYGALASVALSSAANYYSVAKSGMPVDVHLFYYTNNNQQNTIQFIPNSERAFNKITKPNPITGTIYLTLTNNNTFKNVDVFIKVGALIITKTWADKTYTKQVMKPIYQKHTEKVPVILQHQVPINSK
jgi:hypothetical protein